MAPLAMAPMPPLPAALMYFSASSRGIKSSAPAAAPPVTARSPGFSTWFLTAAG